MRQLVLVAASIALALPLAGCARSQESLRQAVGDLPGVIRVEVTDNGGEDDLPFSGPLPNVVSVTMLPDSTTEQVLAVVDEVAEDRAAGDVESLSIGIAGTRGTVSLILGQMVDRPEPYVAALVALAGDPDVVEAVIDPYTDDPDQAADAVAAGEASITLRPVPYRRVHEIAQSYDRRLPPITTGVRSGGTLIMLDGGSRTTTRLAVADAVERRFGLRAAVVGTTGVLRLQVPPTAAVEEVRSFVRDRFGAAPGPVRITAAPS